MPFSEIVGHRPLVVLLARAIGRGTLTPSLILSGPEGVGKRLTAVAIAQALNCTAPRSDAGGGAIATDACGTCAACRRITRGAHPDVQIVEPGDSGSIKIDQIRGAIDAAVFRPFEGRRRVTIVDDADGLLVGAQNALLKTLEEPLPASVFVLVTARPDMLLPTVRSRCAHVRFGRLQVADVARVLERAHGRSHADALTAAAGSEGSVSRALALETGEYAQARADAERVLQAGGRDPRTRLDEAKALLKGSGPVSVEREFLGARLQAMASVLRDVGLLSSGADVRLLANLDRRAALDGLVRTFGAGDRAARGFDAVGRAQEALDRNVSPKVVADWVALNV